jgi:outer membrane receptor for ferrienterochelin and colicin
MHIKRILQLFLAVIAIPFAVAAQVTTGNITGTVRTISGENLSGANIEAIHEPTGTIYRTSSRKDGRYDISNVSAGGPYTIKASFVGFEADTRNDVFITLGENFRIEFRLKDSKGELVTATVTGRRTASSAKGGTETIIGRDKLANAPNVGRNLSDFVRFTPQVKVTGDGGIAVAGQNNRFNAFLIDGAVNNDVFGLSASGTNGGQAGTPPISIDAIDQLAVQISNYDASIGNFTGGAINAITRQGTNQLGGSLYYYLRNPGTTGRSPVPQLKDGSLTQYERAKSVDFQNQTVGFRVGGPIIKNKLFFFLNAEKQNDERPQPFNPNDYRGNAINDGSLDAVVNYLKTNFNYDPGQYKTNPDKIDRVNVNTRFDYNMNAKNKITFSYRYTNTERINPGRSGQNSIQFYNGAQLFPSVTNSGSLELNTRINNKSSNKARITFTNVKDDRGFIGDPFPGVTIFDGTASINFGSEAASTANLLKQNIINIFDVYKKFLGKHTLSMGTDIDINKTYNLFINRNYGLYQFNSVGDFVNNLFPSRYRRGFSLVDAGKSGDASVNSAAEFNSWRLGLFVNDDIRVNDRLTLTLGLRADRFEFLDKAPVDKFWTDTAEARIIAAGYDLRGAKSGQLAKPRVMISPRLGFRYNIDEEGITFRGGIGLFTGRTPLVWPGGVYQNTGVTIGGVDINSLATATSLGLRFRRDVNNQYDAVSLLGGNALPSGDLNLIAGDYKLPQVLRTTLAADKKLGNGWSFSIEGTFTKNIHETNWRNLSLRTSTDAISAGPGPRNIYTSNANIQLRNTGNLRPYTNIILIENTKERKGYAWNTSMTIDKTFSNNWSFNLSYTYGASAVNNEGTSSVNTSNWQNMENANNRNALQRSTSDFDLGHRILGYASKKFNYAKGHLGTTVSFVYNGQSGSPISYVQSGSAVNDGVFNNDLIYVPANRAEVDQMVFLSNTFNGVTFSAPQQRDLFWNFIQSNKYLRKRAGQFAERNGDRLPFTHIVDMKIQQDVSLKVGGHKYSFQVSFDLFNLPNLINNDWGRQYFANFDAIQVLQFAGYTALPAANTPQYRFSPILNNKPWIVSDGVTPFNSSRWSGQLGLRFNF